MPATTSTRETRQATTGTATMRRHVRGVVAMAGALAAVVGTASAQVMRDVASAAPSARDVMPACQGVVEAASAGTWRAQLRLAIRRSDSDLPLARPAADYVLDAIRQQLVLPPTLDSDTWRPGRDSLGYAMLASRVYVELARGDGRVKKAGVLVRSGSPALDAALLAAVRAADSTRSIGPLGELTGHEMLPVVIDLTTVSPAVWGAEAPASMVVGEMALPVVRGYVAARPAKLPFVRVGEDGNEILGRMAVDYVIDRDGKVAPGTTDVRSFSNVDFAGQVLRAMPLWVHEPARIGTCRVRQFAQQHVDSGGMGFFSKFSELGVP